MGRFERRVAMEVVTSLIELLIALITLYVVIKPLAKHRDKQKPPKG